MSDLAARLRTEAPALGALLVAEMYRDPFWEARYGERGRKHAHQDAAYHLAYLAESLEAADPTVMQRYARWLRGVLVSRGMCSSHLGRSFHWLAGRLAENGRHEAGEAVAHLRAAEEALLYEGGASRAVQDASAALVEYIGGDPAEADVWISYLADGLHLDDPDVLQTWARWAADAGILRLHPAHALAALETGLGRLPPPHEAAARGHVVAARLALAG